MNVDVRRNVSRASFACLLVTSGLLTAAFRFLAIRGFNNDHFIHLSGAQQMLFGDWPTRDFIDIGRPLTIAASAAAQYLLGHDLFAEAVLVSAAFGVAAAMTAALIAELTGSLWVAAAATAMEVLAFPRTYSYPKILVTAAALWCMAAFLRRPTRMRHALLAATVTIGFLFRHDLGLFAGIGAVAAVAIADPDAPRRARLTAILRFVALVTAMIAPYAIYVQATTGVSTYVMTMLEANGAEAGYVWPNPFAAAAAAEARLLYVFHMVPVAAFVLCIADWRRGRNDWRLLFVAAAALLTMAENIGLMRDLLKARVPDAIVGVVVLSAWLAWRGWAGSPWMSMAAAVAIVAVAFLIVDLGSVGDNLDRANVSFATITHPAQLLDQFAVRSAMLRDRFASDPPSRVIEPMTPFFRYLDRCTTEAHRLFLAGMIPEVAYYARRPFAGGAYEHYNYGSTVNQHRVANRLAAEVVPFAIIPSESEQELDRDLPIVATHFRGRYLPLTEVPVTAERSVRILVDGMLPPVARDGETGWPCFK